MSMLRELQAGDPQVRPGRGPVGEHDPARRTGPRRHPVSGRLVGSERCPFGSTIISLGSVLRSD